MQGYALPVDTESTACSLSPTVAPSAPSAGRRGGWAMKIEDDRGRKHDVSRVGATQFELYAGGKSMHEIARQIKLKSSKSVIWTETLGMLLLSFPFLTGVYGLFVAINDSQPLGFVLLLFVIASLGILLLLAAITRPKTLRREVDRLMAEFKMLRATSQECHICEYNLKGLAPEPDGCTVCPECGAAWNLQPSESVTSP